MLVRELRFRRAAGSVFAIHCGLIAALVTMHIAVYWLLPRFGLERTGPVGVFDMHNEISIPNQFSALALLVAAGLAAFIAMLQEAGERRRMWSWLFVAACLGAMAVDEACGLHDRLADVGQRKLNTQGVFLIGWTLPYFLLVVLVGGVGSVLMRSVSPRTRLRLAVAGATFVAFALGFEMAEGLLLQEQGGAGASYSEAKSLGNPPWWDALVTIEEAGEMLAVALAIRALLLHLDGDLGASLIARRAVSLGAGPETASVAGSAGAALRGRIAAGNDAPRP